MKKRITQINEAARKELDVTRDEYALCSYIHYRCADPRQAKPGWCGDTKDEIADFVGITRVGLYKMVGRMEAKALIESDPLTGFYRANPTFIDVENEARSVNKVYNDCKQSLHGSVNFVNGIKRESNKVDKGGNNLSPNKSGGAEKKGAKKETPKAAMSPQELATLFDAVATECFTAANIQFQPMNWRAAPGRDFAALNKILEFVTADVVNKTPEEIRKGVEYIFKYGWDLMNRNVQGGGAVQFYPHVIQRNYTQILNHARASHQPKPPNQSGGKQSFAERRNAAEREALRELILDFSAPSGEPEW